jgi:hypothetical protein
MQQCQSHTQLPPQQGGRLTLLYLVTTLQQQQQLLLLHRGHWLEQGLLQLPVLQVS